jgi:hypothetical protein
MEHKKSNSGYASLQESDDFEGDDQDQQPPRKNVGTKSKLLLVISLFTNAWFFAMLLVRHFTVPSWSKDPLLAIYCKYRRLPHSDIINRISNSENKAPANEAVEYETRVFVSSTRGGTLSQYQGEPNEDNNKAWLELFECELCFSLGGLVACC